MTISSTARKAGPFSGTGVQTTFPFAFKVFATSDVLVVQADAQGNETPLSLGSQYTAVLNLDQNANPGGTVSLTSALPVGSQLTISSAIPATQGQSIPNNGGFYPKVIEQALDKLTILAQQTADNVARTIRFAFSDPNSDGALPLAVVRAGRFLAFDAVGNPIAASGTGADSGLRTDLAASTGAAAVGFGTDSVAGVLKAIRLTDYAALRVYTGGQKNVEIIGYLVATAPSGIAGTFVRDDQDTTSADNGGTCIVDSLGRRWKRVFRGPANVRWFGAAADWSDNTGLGTDDTDAVQAALNAHAKVHFPAACRVTRDLSMNLPYAALSGDGMFSGSAIVRTGAGAGTILTCSAATQYPRVEDMYVRWVPWTITDYFNTNTVAIDTTAGNSSIKLYNAWLRGCQTLVKGAYNSYYNKAIGCRFEEFQDGLYQFSVNNLRIEGNRFKNFNSALTVNGNGGPTNIFRNSFEVFNGALVSAAGAEKGLVNFHHNYVEIYDNVNLPTNFPQAPNGKPGKFGGQALFSGPFGTLSIRNNDLSIGGVVVISGLSICDHFESVNNTLHLYAANNNLLRMHNLPTLKSCHVRDRIGDTIGPDGGYTRVYDQATNVPSLDSPYGEFEFYDAVLDRHLLCPSMVYAPTLINGWTNNGAPDGVPALIYTKEGLYPQGVVSGPPIANTVIFNLPISKRPLELSQNRAFCFLSTNADEGAGPTVQLRYIYSTGDFRLENTPSSANNIVLDGLFIPARI